MTEPVDRVTDELLARIEAALNFDGMCRPSRMEGNRDLARAIRTLRNRAREVVQTATPDKDAPDWVVRGKYMDALREVLP